MARVVHDDGVGEATPSTNMTSSIYFRNHGTFFDCLCLCCCGVEPTPVQSSPNASANGGDGDKIGNKSAAQRLDHAGPDSWREQWWRKLATKGRVRDKYTMGKKLGKGSFSTVHEAVEINGDGTRWAAKLISLRGSTQEERMEHRETVLREAAMMLNLTHDGLLNLREFFVEENAVVLILEMMKGSTLLDYVLDKGGYSERDAAVVFKIVLEALKYMHVKRVVHRDIKLENLMLARRSDPYSVKITDFGFACHLDANGHFSGMAGTPAYLAPEVVARIQRRKDAARRFTPAVDMWAAGASLFLMLGGYPPFDGSTTEEVFNEILQGHVTFSEPSWEAVSQRAKRLIEKLMRHEPEQRYTASQALASDWIVNPPAELKAGGGGAAPSHRGGYGGGEGGGGSGYGSGGMLEESGRGLARYRRRSSGGQDLNLSGSVQRESTMLQLQEKHNGSRGRGLNDSLRRIFGLNKNRVPAAAVNEREGRSDSLGGADSGRDRAPAMQQGCVGHTFVGRPGGASAPPPQKMSGESWVPVVPGGEGADVLGAGASSVSSPLRRAMAPPQAPRAPAAGTAAPRRAPGWGSGTSTPVGFTPEMQQRMYAQQGFVGGPGRWAAAAEGGGAAAFDPLAHAHVAAAQAAEAHAAARRAEQAAALERLAPMERLQYLREQMQAIQKQNAVIAYQLQRQRQMAAVTVPYGAAPPPGGG